MEQTCKFFCRIGLFFVFSIHLYAADPIKTEEQEAKAFNFPEPSQERVQIDIEGGGAWVSKNRIRIPGKGGTDLSLTSQGEADFYYRVYLGLAISPHHRVRGLFAPFMADFTLIPTTTVEFNGSTFAGGAQTSVRYIFNSYRLGYTYVINPSEPLEWRLGFTGKIRDASVRLSNGLTSSQKSNVGFVPLLNGGVNWSITSEIFYDLDFEGLAAPQGRAFDVATQLGWKVRPRLWISVGYRFLEGGADNDTVYNFAFLQYAFGRVTMRF